MRTMLVLVALSGCAPSVSSDAGFDSGVEDAGVEDAGTSPPPCLVALKNACGPDAGTMSVGGMCITSGSYDGGNGIQTSVFNAAGVQCATFAQYGLPNEICEVVHAEWRDADGHVVATGVSESFPTRKDATCVDGGTGAWVTF